MLFINLAVRVMLGETKPAASKPGTIRGDYCIQVEDCIFSMHIAFHYHDLKVGRNICHGSDAVESAEHEIKLWFRQVHCSFSLLAGFFTFFLLGTKTSVTGLLPRKTGSLETTRHGLHLKRSPDDTQKFFYCRRSVADSVPVATLDVTANTF